MNSLLRLVLANPLFTGSFVMIVGSNLTNFINYIYHLLMGRFLGPSLYGDLASLLSLSGLLAMIPGSLSLVIIKFVSSAKDQSQTSQLISWLNDKAYKTGILMSVLVLVASPFLANFLHLDPVLVITLGLTFTFSIPSLMYRSTLQGMLKFTQNVLTIIAENSTKLILGVIAVYLGYSVFGALIAFNLAIIFGWFLARKFVNVKPITEQSRSINLKRLLSYSLPILIYSVSATSLISSDLILVKHFFSSHESGLYSALSNLGKIIFYGSGPIGAVMFPIVSAKFSKKQGYLKVLISSIGMSLGLSVLILIFYLLFPKLAILMLYGELYLEISSLLVWFGLFITVFTLSSLLASFYLSINRTKVVWLLTVAAIAQIGGIWIWHHNLAQVINISLVVSSILLGGLILFPILDRMKIKSSVY